MTKALVLSGDGINCEQETAFAARKAGFAVDVIHINDLIRQRVSQEALKKTYRALFLPGGFSFGDHLGSGRVLALKVKKGLSWDLHDFARSGGIVLGICNGFQALIAMGTFGVKTSITHNRQNQFLDRWAELRKAPQTRAVLLKHLQDFILPIRHGEGRLLFDESVNVFDNPDFQVALQYQEDVNGSTERIAGLTDPTGRILGLMPHPEAAIRRTQHPLWTEHPDQASDEESGILFFKNAYEEARCL